MRTFAVLVTLLSAVATGQVTKSTTTVSFPNCSSTPAMASYEVDVYRPAGAGPFGLVGIGHGYQMSKANHEVLARALAAKGLVVVVPQFPLLLALQCGASDHSRNADLLWAAMEQQRALGGLDARLGVVGHSAGGLAAFLLASRHAAVQAVVLLDAVDNSNLGLTAATDVAAPTLFLSAEGSTCNSQNNSAGWYPLVTGLEAKLRVVGATHCDPQDPVNGTCALTCPGGTATDRQGLFTDDTVAFLDRFLNQVTVPCLDDVFAAQASAGVVSMVDVQLGGCGAGADAGVDLDAGVGTDAGSEVDAGSGADAGDERDAGASPDAGTAEDAGVQTDAGTGNDAGAERDAGAEEDAGTGAPPDAGVTADAGGDVVPTQGCGCTQAEGALVLLALAGLKRRRRH